MLIWNVKQFAAARRSREVVVIWCLFEMRNSTITWTTSTRQLWFDAYLKWETVWRARRAPPSCCDLMLIWNVKQSHTGDYSIKGCCDLMLIWNVKQSLRQIHQGRSVVIWCSFEMWNSPGFGPFDWRLVVIWCSFEMWNSTTKEGEKPNEVVIWCSFEMWNSALIFTNASWALWFDAHLKCETVVPLYGQAAL